ncbi:MAG: energy-coupling factor transporter transmembrane protein EcfT, partial [Clostridia bacterium]|nr:energy-coupling factor transporter transmembrane protein EcfT [Clostridia bacterium]
MATWEIKIRDHFGSYHPFVNLLYFVLVVAFSLIITHPIAQAISLISAVLYAVTAEGGRSIAFLLRFCLPTVLLTAIINPAFNHEGTTVLLYFGTGNPLTLESVLYGLGAGVMLVTVLLWFSAFNRVMTSDKIIFLFGKLIPALSLIISMTLRFIPKFKTQMATVTEAQRCLGRDVSEG